MKALTFSSFGKPDVLEYIEVKEPVLKRDQILVQMKAIGLNYADMMPRSGIYNVRGNAPYINGYEPQSCLISVTIQWITAAAAGEELA